MESNQVTPSSETSGIPQGIPTGVFVPNNQPVVAQAVETPSVAPTNPSVAPVTPVAPTGPGALDKFLQWVARFFARIMGQPDPITWAVNPASQAMQAWQNIVGKVRGAANQVVEKAGDVAGQAVNTVNQATQQIQQVIPQPTAAAPSPQVPPVAPIVEQQPTQSAQPVQ